MADSNKKEKNADLGDKPKFRINGFYLKDVSFENPGAPKIFTEANQQPQIDMALDVQVAKVEGTAFEVVLKANVQAKIEESPLFIVEVLQAGLFVMNPELEKEEMEETLLVDCAYAVFPYLRKAVSELTQDGGFAPLNLEQINFRKLYLDKGQAEQEAKSKAVN